MFAVAIAASTQAQVTPLPLSGLDGVTGFIVNGAAVGDGAGRSVSAASDGEPRWCERTISSVLAYLRENPRLPTPRPLPSANLGQ